MIARQPIAGETLNHCGKPVLRSTLRTLMGFSAPPGHVHDGNRYTATINCMECGKTWRQGVVLGPPCPKQPEGCPWRPPTHWIEREVGR